MSKIIDRFSGEYRFLSNFQKVDINRYRTLEHAYQASKTHDLAEKELIRDCLTAREAKSAGRIITIRDDWEDIKLDVMFNLLMIKFSKPTFKLRLLQTGDATLIEGNTWGDTFWGVCRGVGENHLGQQLMMLRNFLKNG